MWQGGSVHLNYCCLGLRERSWRLYHYNFTFPKAVFQIIQFLVSKWNEFASPWLTVNPDQILKSPCTWQIPPAVQCSTSVHCGLEESGAENSAGGSLHLPFPRTQSPERRAWCRNSSVSLQTDLGYSGCYFHCSRISKEYSMKIVSDIDTSYIW